MKLPTLILEPDFRDMLSTLCAHQVEFLLIGSYAMALHGFPRATGDIDFWIRPSRDNAKRVLNALAEYGAPVGNLSAQDLATPGLFFQVGVTPLRIDILTKISGIDFDEADKNRVEIEVDGLLVPVIGLSDLVIAKRAAGRPKDLFDVDWMEKSGKLSQLT